MPLKWRALFAAAVAVCSGVAAWYLIGRPAYTSDFAHVWSASRTFLGGGDPYATPLNGGLNPGQDPAFYPLPTYLLLAPLAHLPLALAGGVFVGLGSGLAAWGIAGTGMSRAPIFLSTPFILAVSLGQWAPWLVAAALLPWLSWVAVAKPNIGVATWIARPWWQAAVAIAAIVAVSLLLRPDWPQDWLANVSGRQEKLVPLLRPGGFLLLATLVAWRRPEARLLLAMSVVPQALFFYDQLPLWLVPRTLRQSLVLSLYSGIAFIAWFSRLAPDDFYVQRAVPWAHSLYFIAAAMVLWNWWRDQRASSPRS